MYHERYKQGQIIGHRQGQIIGHRQGEQSYTLAVSAFYIQEVRIEFQFAMCNPAIYR